MGQGGGIGESDHTDATDNWLLASAGMTIPLQCFALIFKDLSSKTRFILPKNTYGPADLGMQALLQMLAAAHRPHRCTGRGASGVGPQ